MDAQARHEGSQFSRRPHSPDMAKRLGEGVCPTPKRAPKWTRIRVIRGIDSVPQRRSTSYPALSLPSRNQPVRN